MSFTTINAPDAPKALGSYSHGIKSGSMILTSGQIALDPKTGVLEKETCASTRQVLANLLAIVRAGGGDLEASLALTLHSQMLLTYLSSMTNTHTSLAHINLHALHTLSRHCLQAQQWSFPSQHLFKAMRLTLTGVVSDAL